MGKAPAFQFYVKDWLSDPQLRMASLSTRGIWIDLLCYMWSAPERGKLEIMQQKFARLIGADNGEVELFIDEAQAFDFCDISVTGNGTLQIYNRRMYRESKDRENNRLRQQKYRDKKQDNAKITPPSPSPTPSPTPHTKKKECAWPKDFTLTEKMRSYAKTKGIVKVDAFFDDFKDWAAAKGATYKDWQAAFRTRVGKAPEYGKQFMGENSEEREKTNAKLAEYRRQEAL